MSHNAPKNHILSLMCLPETETPTANTITVALSESRIKDFEGDTLVIPPLGGCNRDLPMSYTREDGTIQDNEVAFMYPNTVKALTINRR